MSLHEQILALIARQPDQHTQAMADELGITEGELIRALPAEWVTLWSGEQAEALLGRLTSWGALTTIVESAGSIFEFKGPFPAGRKGHGYYNLVGDKSGGECGLHGHLKLDDITNIALLSKPFMRQPSHAFVFITGSGRCAFKVYLGRDQARQLLPEQVACFEQWRALDGLPPAENVAAAAVEA